jgi:CheY-like chemotaxis protein
MGLVVGPLFSQDKKPPLQKAEDEYRQFFKKPETAREFWAAMRFEIGVGKFALAAEDLKGFLAKKPTDEELLQIEQEQGMAAFLGLLNVPELRADAKPLLERVTEVIKKHRSDPERLRRLVKSLLATPEERSYAIGELRRSGSFAVPYLIDALKNSPTLSEHASILSAMLDLPADIVPPVLAALDVEDAIVRIELIDLLEQRGDKRAVPFLWYLSASAKQPEQVRRKAQEALVFFLGDSFVQRNGDQFVVTQRALDQLPPAKVALTREADQYYQHRVRFPDSQQTTVWQWKNGQLVAQTMTASQAEEYYALRFAGQALDLDPEFVAAQIVFLSAAIDKAVERGGLDQALDKGLAAKELARIVNPELDVAVLERALADRRLTVILGTIRALGDLGEVRAVRGAEPREPALERALFYPDRRVQLAAAEALLRIPATGPQRHAARLVEILRRPLFVGALPKVLVIDANKARANDTGAALGGAGYEAVIRNTGREALLRLAETPDIDAVIVDHAIVDPPLPYVLAQLRADADVASLPVLITMAPDKTKPELEPSLKVLADRYRHVWVLPGPLAANDWKTELGHAIADTMGQPLSEDERKANSSVAILWLKRLAVGEVAGYDIRPAQAAIFKALETPELAALAIEAAGRLPGPAPQRELLRVVAGDAPAPIRAAAAAELARHIQVHGNALTGEQTKAIAELYESSADPKVKDNIALVLGSLHPDARVTGIRLQRYTPSLAAPPKEK